MKILRKPIQGFTLTELMVTLADILKSRMEAMDDAKRSRTVFSVFMEGMQNLIWHGRTEQSPTGMVCISSHDDEIVIVCGNRLARAESVKLRTKKMIVWFVIFAVVMLFGGITSAIMVL